MDNNTRDEQYGAEFKQAFLRGMEAGLQGLEASHGLAIVPDGAELKSLERFEDQPRKTAAHVTVTDLESFQRYLGVFASKETVIFADDKCHRIKAVIDYHTAESPQWGEHQLVLVLSLSEPWRAWKGMNGQSVPHAKAAEFLEERAVDIIAPEAAEVLEVAQGLQVDSSAKVVSIQSLSGGKRVTFEESDEVRAASDGVDAPEKLTLSIPIFERFEYEELTVRLFYRVRNKQLCIGFRVLNAAEVERAVFDSIVDRLQDEGRYVLRGGVSDFGRGSVQ